MVEITDKTSVEIAPLNHDWNAPAYTWNADNTVCTATRTCKRDAGHKETATATVTSAQTKARPAQQRAKQPIQQPLLKLGQIHRPRLLTISQLSVTIGVPLGPATAQVTGINVLAAMLQQPKRLTITVLTMFATPADITKLYRTLTI